MSDNILEMKAKLLGSFLFYVKIFFKLRTGRDFRISDPIGRESHFITMAREFTRLFRLESNRLIINVPPGFGKSEFCVHFITWAMAHYPDCNFMYICYSQSLAAKHTYTCKRIMEMPYYRKLFGVELAKDSQAKDNFRTTAGGSVMAFGSGGAIAGQDSGLPHLDRFGGCPIYDDPHNLHDVFSDVIREGTIENYNNSVKPRILRSGANAAAAVIGQRSHENDLFNHLISGNDGYDWHHVKLKAIDDAGNALYPELNSLEMLLKEKEFNPYYFWSQQQQEPTPPGGGIFKPEWFMLTDEEPQMLATFITADTAETEKDYNDATAFSFWGVYKIHNNEAETDLLGLHWIDCI